MPRKLGPLSLCALASGLHAICATVPRAAPSDYPAQSSTPELTLAGEYYGRSAPAGKSTIFTGHYLVVEVAVYPAKGLAAMVSPSELRLFINHAKTGLPPQSSSVVAGTLKYYGYEYGERGLDVGVGAGPIFVPSQPRQGPSFPGDPTDRQRTRPTAPGPGDDPNGEPRQWKSVPDDPSEVLPGLDLEPGETSRPVSGCLYFFWKAHTKKIRNMELRWQPSFGAPPKAVLKLVSQPR